MATAQAKRTAMMPTMIVSGRRIAKTTGFMQHEPGEEHWAGYVQTSRRARAGQSTMRANRQPVLPPELRTGVQVDVVGGLLGLRFCLAGVLLQLFLVDDELDLGFVRRRLLPARKDEIA